MVRVNSTIHSVRVFRSGATITRRFEVRGDGEPIDEIEVRPLPLALVDATVRVRVLTTDAEGADVIASHVRVGLSPREEREAPPTPELDALKAAQRDLARLKLTRRLARAELAAIDDVFVPDRPEGEEGKPPPPSPLMARAALEQMAWDASAARKKETRELRERIREAARKVEELQARVNEASSARQLKPGELAKTVLARLTHEGPAFSHAELELEYFVPGARWAPSYQCHLQRDGSAAHVQFRALVVQNSGEDWRGVQLELSTAAPLSFTELPELSALRIGRAQRPPPDKRGFRPPPKGGSALFADYDRGQQDAVGLLPRGTGWQPPSLPSFAPPGEPGAPGDFGALAQSAGPATQAIGGATRGAPPRPKRRSRSAPPMAAPADLSKEITSEGAAVHDGFDAMPLAPPAPSRASLDALSDDEESDDAEMFSLEEADEFESTTELVDVGGGGAAPAKKRSRAAPQMALEAVAFTQLLLGAPEDRAWRGRLRPIEPQENYLEVLARAHLEVSFDIMTVVRAAQSDSFAVGSLRLPEGAVDVGRVSGSFDFKYDADGAVDVPSDDTFHSIALGTRACDATLRYVVVPRLDTHVFREARLTNPLDAPLLAGPTEVYVGGEYVLTTRLPTVAPGGEFRLGLGVEQAIKCARNTKFNEVRSGEKVVAMTELEHEIDIDVANNLAQPVDVEVRERVPQPEPGAEVVTEEADVSPAWEAYDQEERGHLLAGGRRWRVVVAAGEEVRLHARYVVKIYANNELVGGNRREA